MSDNYITFEELKLRLRPIQRKAAELLVKNDFAPKNEKKTLQEVADEVGIDVRTLYSWRQNPDFTRYIAAVSDGELASYRSLADSQLINLIKGTSNNGVAAIRALELFYKLEGRLVDRSVITSEDKGSKRHYSRDEISKGLEELNKYVN